MGRILVGLAFACLVGAFVMLSRNNNEPPHSGTISNTNASKQGNTRTARSSQQPMGNQARAADRRPNATAKSSRSADVPQNASAVTAATNEVKPDREESAPQPTVKDEGTPMYSLNSKSSKVVKRLKKGEKVNTDVEVLDSEGRWSLVKELGKSGSGFVRGENLEKPSKNILPEKTRPVQHP